MKTKLKAFFKQVYIAFLSTYFFLLTSSPAFAQLDITAGLDNVDASTLANKIVAIATGIGAVIGAVAVGVAIYCGFRIATAANERSRAEATTHLMWALGAVAIVGLSLLAVGFVANIIQNA